MPNLEFEWTYATERFAPEIEPTETSCGDFIFSGEACPARFFGLPQGR